MSSFVNLMANHVWSEADIVARTEAMIHSEFSREAENILNRKVTGAVVGSYTLTAEEQAQMAQYAQVCEQARQAGNAARADMALLAEVLAVETAQRRLALPLVEPVTAEPVVEGEPPVVTNQAALDADAAERAAAQAAVDGASAAVTDLVTLRNPPPPPEPTPDPVVTP